MRIVEVSGKTVEEAVARALEQLGLPRDQVDVDVINEGRRGVFGIGQEPAIVRVTALTPAENAEPSARPPRQRGPRREGPREGAREGGEGRRREGGEPQTAEPRESQAAGSGVSEGSRSSSARGERSGRGERGGRGGYSRNRGEGGSRSDGPRGGGMRAESLPPRGTGESGPPVTVPGAPDEPPVAPIVEAEDEVDFAGRTVRDVLTLLGLTDTEIAAREPESAGDGVGLVTQILDIYGDNEEASHELGLLIGRRGETLASLQYLLNVLVSTKYGNDHVFAIDIDQYKRRREQTLVAMAQRIAAEVRETGDVITLEPMSAAERRIIHVTLAEEPGVRTESVGQGQNRQVEVMPDEGGPSSEA
ncbi:MAG: Jag N-terminal domain-containing protein [Dehalococcoidia bacterium]|nr:Jag N-terminal domain-containing protein [Dehalococcoidia bacterium]